MTWPLIRSLAASVAAILAVSLAGGSRPILARTDPTPSAPVEYQIKAAFLYNFAKFVEWPSSAFEDGNTLVIGVLGEDPFDGAIDQAIEGKVVNGRRLVLKRFAGVEDLHPTQVLFISGSAARDLDEVLAKVHGAHVLAVGEGEGFTARGGVISFFMEENKVRFEVNLDAAKSAGLHISSKLLGVARIAAGSGRER